MGHHVAHQLLGFRGDRKVGKAGREPGHSQDTYRVFAECIGHVAQHFGLQVTLAAKRVGQPGFINF